MSAELPGPHWADRLTPEIVEPGVVGYSCPLGCGWRHVEHPGHEQLPGFWLPDTLDRCTPEQLSTAITAAAAELTNARLARIDQACAHHFTTAHPTVDPARLLAALAHEKHDPRGDQRRHHATRDAFTDAITRGAR
ncbi:hypothetical protein [Nocardia asiatica]|uniref:hypothetical protein n=1 Tax=Nocardia asiatica TaxID=209252 RepID=UPI0024568E60|nr:hypothetical protein [Nocardia asiatica]